MDRWDWMAVKAYMPAMFGLFVAVLAMGFASSFPEGSLLQGFGTMAMLASAVALLLAVGHGSWVSFRLWRASHGDGLLCDCGGLLGRERGVRYGPYRRCMGCGRNVAQRHYE